MVWLIAMGKGFFFLSFFPGGGNRVAVRGGVKQALTCGLRVEWGKPRFAAGHTVYPAEELPERAGAKSLSHRRPLGRSDLAT